MTDLRSDALWKTSATRCAVAAALLAAGAAAYRSVTSTDEHARAAPPRSADAAGPPRPTPPSDAERTLDLVCGASPGSLGSVFRGVELGRIVARLPDVPSRAGLGEITVETTGRRIDGVTVVVPIDPGWADCYRFIDQLHRRWGHPSETSAGSETWHGAHDATFTRNLRDCRLRFSRVVSPEDWLNDARSSRIPIWAIGHPVAELEAELGLPPGDDPKALHWRDDSLELIADLKHGRVSGIRVQVPFDDSLGEILWHRLKALFGAPDLTSGHEESMHVRWLRAPRIDVGKYWGHDGDVRTACRYAQACPGLREAPRQPTPDEGVLMDIVFGG